jgi:hypothetical protein
LTSSFGLLAGDTATIPYRLSITAPCPQPFGHSRREIGRFYRFLGGGLRVTPPHAGLPNFRPLGYDDRKQTVIKPPGKAKECILEV